MTPRERFTRALRGESVDRMPFHFGGPRTSTFAAWRKQGLSEEQIAKWGAFTGEDPGMGIGKFDFGPLPGFEERVVEERDGVRIWQDHWGVLRVDSVNQPTPGFATRKYLEFPVKSHADFSAMRERFEATDPARTVPQPGENARRTYNPDGYRVYQATTCWRERVEACNDADRPVMLTIPGLWWTARDWAGFEGLCMMCAEQPSLVHEMMDFWTDFIIALLDEPLSAIRADLVIMNEDMAYKHAAMCSPAHMRRFMLPGYRRIYSFLKQRGVTCVAMDTDGHNSQVLDVFFPEVIDGIVPMEIAANNDPAVYLARHPGLFIEGGIDKRELCADRPRVRAEVARRFATARQFGRYIPVVDHGVPPDVPLRNFIYMVELIKGFAAGMDLATWEPDRDIDGELGPITEMFDPRAAIDATRAGSNE